MNAEEKVWTSADLRWHISDAYCAGRGDCNCTQLEIDSSEAKCWKYADGMMKKLADEAARAEL